MAWPSCSSSSATTSYPERVSIFLQRVWTVDLRSLALLRFCYGVIILLDLAWRATDLSAHYTDWGVAPRQAVIELADTSPAVCLHLADGTLLYQAMLFAVQGLAAAALAVGYRTRLAGPLCWFLLSSLQARNPIVCDGGDNFLRVILFWSLFLPWGARYSLDAAGSSNTCPPAYRSGATLCYLVQICLVYGFAALLKTGQDWRQDGSAVYYALSIDQLATPLAPWLLAHPSWMKALSFATLAFEAVAPFLLCCPGPLRLLGVVGLSFMHLGFGLFLHLGLFTFIGLTSSWGLLPGLVWDRLERTTWFDSWRQWGGRLAPLGGAEVEAKPLSGWVNLLLFYLMLLVVQWNLLSLPGIKPRYRLRDSLLKVVRLDQSWTMFAPQPRHEDGWYVVEADLENGQKLDLLRPNAPLSWQKPACVAADYPNPRWRRLMMTLCFQEATAWRLYYARYLTRSWNGSHQGGRRVQSFRIYFMLETTLESGTRAPQKTLLWTHQCQDPR